MTPSAPVSFFRFFDLAALAIFLPAMGWLMWREYRRTKAPFTTISHMVTASGKSAGAYAAMMSIVVPLYYGFWYFWVSPWIRAPKWFYGLLVVSFVCELVFVWYPPVGRWARLHATTAGVVFAVTYLALLMLLLSGVGGAVPRFLVVLGLVAGFIAALVICVRRHAWLFCAELGYCLLFLAAVSWAVHG